MCDLQVDLVAIYHWEDEHNIEFNNTKFECLRYRYNNDLKACTSYKAKSRECITEVDHAKDLGATMSSSGNFKEHIKMCYLLQIRYADGYFGHLIRRKHYP